MKWFIGFLLLACFVFQDAIDQCMIPSNWYASVFRGETLEGPNMTCSAWADMNLQF